jgi:ribosome-associated protein
VNASDTSGAVTYSIAFSDSAGNAGTAVTSGSGSVTIYPTPAVAFAAQLTKINAKIASFAQAELNNLSSTMSGITSSARSRFMSQMQGSEVTAVKKIPEKKKTIKKARSKKTDKTFLNYLLKILHEEKAEDVTTVDLNEKSEIADYMIFASGRSTRQVISLAQNLADKIKLKFDIVSRIEGKEQGDWVLIDSGDIIIHMFRPEVREFYQLEKMWSPDKSVES